MGAKDRRVDRLGFTLVELLVVIGIIAVLLTILMPALNKARRQSETVQCQSNMRQMGMALLIYADQYGGYLFPTDMGWSNNQVFRFRPGDATLGGTPLDLTLPDQWRQYTYNVWPTKVFGGVWNPPVLLCPTDNTDPPPIARHTYILNSYMAYYNEKYGRPLPNHTSPSDAILAGEKTSRTGDYYMEYGDYLSGKVDTTRHGIQAGANYLMLDMHVETKIYPPGAAAEAFDPWDCGNSSGPTSLPSE